MLPTNIFHSLETKFSLIAILFIFSFLQTITEPLNILWWIYVNLNRFWDSQETIYEIISKIRIKWLFISLNAYYMSEIFLSVWHVFYFILTTTIKTTLISQMRKLAHIWDRFLLLGFPLPFGIPHPCLDSKKCFQNQHSTYMDILFCLLQSWITLHF